MNERHPAPPWDGLVAEVATAAAESAGCWFPGLDADKVVVRILRTDSRPRCFLHRIELDDGERRRRAVVKVRHSQPGLRRLDRFAQRPMLHPERTMSDAEAARREYDALHMISDVLVRAPAVRFGVLRPLAWLPGHSGIVMDLVEEPTLRDALSGTSRLHPRRRRQPLDERAWHNAGAWLRLFHDHNDTLALSARNGSREEVAQLYRDSCDFLVQRLGGSPLLSDLAGPGAGLVQAALPAELPLRTGHGDFVANNVFLGPAGRITVFDPLPRWRVPAYQDLSTLVIGIRLLQIQAMTRGLAFSDDNLARHEGAVLGGYFGTEPVPLPALKAYQLLVLLDKWSATVSKRVGSGRVRPHLHAMRVAGSVRHYEREAGRLMMQLSDSARLPNS